MWVNCNAISGVSPEAHQRHDAAHVVLRQLRPVVVVKVELPRRAILHRIQRVPGQWSMGRCLKDASNCIAISQANKDT